MCAGYRYNQTSAEAYFTDAYERIWTGLVNLMAAYASPTSGLASPEHARIAALFRGKSASEALAVAVAMEKQAADTKVAALLGALEQARSARAQLD